MIRDLVFTPRCIGCGTLGVHVCSGCDASLRPQKFRFKDSSIVCHSVGTYEGWLREAIIDYKSGSRAVVFGLALVLARRLPIGVTIVPTPSSRAKNHERGYDTIGLLSRQIARQRKDIVLQPALHITRPVVDQVGLGARERYVNVAGAFRSVRPLSGRILVLDDVVTTGATLSECVRAVQLAGAQQVLAFSLCAGANKSYL